MYFGSFIHNLDEKGRLMIPRKMREELGTKVYIMKGFEGSLSLYNEERYQKLAEEFSRLSFNQSKVRDYLRIQFASTYEMDVDKLGRVQLPTALLTKYGISKEVIVLGIGDHIEVWDKVKYDEYENSIRDEFETSLKQSMLRRNNMEEHIPVLLKETIDGLNIKPSGIYVDLTVGRGGHSSEILSRLKDGHLICVDQDEEAIVASSARLSKISSNFEIVRYNFSHLEEILEEKGIKEADGIMMDLGVSSPQFDQGDRGFSYKEDARLDMRMDQRQDLTAYQIINTYGLEDLNKIFQIYGEEKYSFSIAKNIIKAREVKPIETTLELVEIIKRSKPMKELKKVGHPAKQVFQALRIAVNDELNVLEKTLKVALAHLKPGGRLAVITFHSGEDRIVKNIFKDAAVSVGNRIDGPMTEQEKDYILINHKPITASESELELNHRSASAKLRIIARKERRQQS